MGKRKRRRYGYLLLAICLIMLTACNANSKSRMNSDKKASEVLDVKNLKLKSDDGYGSLRFITPFVENKNYIFYIEDGKRIVKVSKEDKEKTTIITFKHSNKGGLSLEGNYLYYVYDKEVYKSDLTGKCTKILSKENLKKSGMKAKLVSVKMHHNKLYLIMDDYIDLYIVQYDNDKKEYKVLIKDFMNQVCFLGEYVYYIEDGGAGVYEINLNTLKKQRILGIKWYKDYSMDHPSYMEMTAYNGKLYYTRWEENDDSGRQVLYEYRKNKKDKKIFEFQDGAGDAIADSTKIIVFGTVMYDSDHEGMQVYDLKNKKSYFIKKPAYEVGGISFLFGNIILYEDEKVSNNVYILDPVKTKNN